MADKKTAEAPTNPYGHTVVTKEWKSLSLVSGIVPNGGSLIIHRPSYGEEIAIRADVAKYARALGLSIDEWDTYSQNHTFTHFLMKHAADAPEGGIDWLGKTIDSPEESDAYAALQAEVLEWLLRFPRQ